MTGPIQQHEIDNFFYRYEVRFNDALSGGQPDIEETANSFSESFIEASPAGVVVGKNDDKFRESIGQGWNFYKNIGIQSMEILSTQTTILDNLHAIVRVHWNSVFQRKNKSQGEVAFNVFYILQKQEENIRIFAYITGDEQQVLKEEGLIP
jgi:hypothetical protein